MTGYRLILGNKNYSSWSMRPWLAMRVKGLNFDEDVIPLFADGFKEAIRAHSKAGRVPVLHDGDRVIWDSLAILEYLADRHPELGFWPAGEAPRAHARAISAEMHSGFAALRGGCPMIMRRDPAAIELDAPVGQDIERILALWREARTSFGDSGPFLFGAFCNADAMYAPVVVRLHVYAVPVDAESRAYMDAVMDLPAFMDWRRAAIAEPWVIERMER